MGCGGGLFGRAVRRIVGPEAHLVGVEPDLGRMAEGAADAYDTVREGCFPQAVEPGDGPFDCIFFNDVLEHLLDPWAAVRAARTMVVPEGRVVASIPNVAFFPVVVALVRHGRWDYADWGVLDRTHVRFFTRATMVELLEQGGFRVERVQGINSAFGLAKWRRFARAERIVGDAQWMQFVLVARPDGSGSA